MPAVRTSPLVAPLALLLLMTSAPPARTQTGTAVGAIASGVTLFGGPQVLKGLPYTATRRTMLVQHLADGTTITNITTVREARDSEGRTYTESRPVQIAGSTRPPEFLFASVTDPVAGTITTWNSNSKRAYVMHFPTTPPQAMLRSPDPQPAAGASSTFAVRAPLFGAVAQSFAAEPRPVASGAPPAGAVMAALRPEVQHETLPGQTIAGVYATGTRTTTTIPAGMMGNDRPLTIVHETWTAPDLKIVVLDKTTDPRTGERTTEVVDLRRGEPDPSLFEVPPGYTIVDNSPQ